MHKARLGIARYYGIIPYEEVAEWLDVNVLQARLLIECRLFGLVESPSNINVIALGDLGRDKDIAAVLQAFRSGHEDLNIDDEDPRTATLLADSGLDGEFPGSVQFNGGHLDGHRR